MTTPLPHETYDAVVVDVHVTHCTSSDQDERLEELVASVESVSCAVASHGGERLQVRSDGLTVGFAVDGAHAAINAAIDVQQARRPDQPHASWLAIGIATGPVTRLDMHCAPVGPTVERAHRLALSANAGAVLADLDTIVSAQLHQIRSAQGKAQGRRPIDYLSPQGWLPAAMPAAPLQYHEVIWDIYPRGLRPDLLGVPTQLAPVHPGGNADPGWRRGRLRNWNCEKKHGFIATDEGEFFYVDDRFLSSDDPPPVGSEVWFSPRPALIPGKNRVAALVTSLEEVGGDEDGKPVVLHDHAGNTATLAPRAFQGT